MAGKMKICILADFFKEDMNPPTGGGEACTDALIQALRQDHKLSTRKCHLVTPEFIEGFDGRLIVSNRQNLSEGCKEVLYKKDYILYDHDFHWITGRDVGIYEDLKVPEADIINREIYKNAKKVVFQSQVQLHAAKINLKYDHFVSANGNMWSKSDLDLLKGLQDIKRTKGNIILNHPYPTKGTLDAVEWCKSNDWKYSLLPPMPQSQFLENLAEYNLLVFFPQIFETYSRVSAQAAALNLDLVLNQRVSFQHEEHARLKGMELISYFDENNSKIVKLFIE